MASRTSLRVLQILGYAGAVLVAAAAAFGAVGFTQLRSALPYILFVGLAACLAVIVRLLSVIAAALIARSGGATILGPYDERDGPEEVTR